jgi:ABC-type proline/glycine betaine transport system permease subunit
MSWTLDNYDRLGEALAEHVMLVGIALGISLVIAFPLGIWAARMTELRPAPPRLPRFAREPLGPKDCP